METVEVKIKQVKGFENFPLPTTATGGSSAVDLYAAINNPVFLTLRPGERRLVPTGICISLPEGYEAQIRPRSGLALTHGISIVNSPGTIDSDYRGQVSVILINHGDKLVNIDKGQRIAQMVIQPVIEIKWILDAFESDTARGEGGFGSTGKHSEGIKFDSPSSTAKSPSNKYLRKIALTRGTVEHDDIAYSAIDVYDVLEAFNVTCPATTHAIKKLLCLRIRDSKNVIQDLQEAQKFIQRAIQRAIELEDSVCNIEVAIAEAMGAINAEYC